jgi:hypothetical protein
MELRNHPLMSYHGVSNWPPVWTWRCGPTIRRLRGEVGVLKEVVRSMTGPMEHFFLVMQLNDNEYLGALLFEDPTFCSQIYNLLLTYCGHTIKDTGDLDVSHLL